MSDWHEAWVAALDALEADVATVEKLLETSHLLADLPVADAWTPPPGLGPLPLDLRPRADRILGRQINAAEAIAVAIVTNRRQARVTERIGTGYDSGQPRPAYVDTAM
ncbi:hypothetical protein ACNTMW_21980 [Planosporangium sp. 12N6]|uniref:hypothetical protein n=1 Tax=Planosporangium spinosum TaxID=3402278 RepID=UPI003CFBAE8F